MSDDGSPRRRWDEPGWQHTAEAWIRAVLTDRGITVTAPIIRERTRFWSVHLTAPTDAGRFWFKETCPLQSFEARLIERLRPVAGDLLVEDTAAEPDQGWLLTPDQGAVARDAERGPDVTTYERLLSRWGTLERAIMAAEVDLPGSGATTMAPDTAAEYLLTQVERLTSLRPTTSAGCRWSRPPGCAGSSRRCAAGSRHRCARPRATRPSWPYHPTVGTG